MGGVGKKSFSLSIKEREKVEWAREGKPFLKKMRHKRILDSKRNSLSV